MKRLAFAICLVLIPAAHAAIAAPPSFGAADLPSSSPQQPNTLSPAEAAAGWQLLSDGKTTAGWRGFQKKAFPDGGWAVEDGTLKCLGRKGGDILTTATFTDFEFAWEWRLSPQANSRNLSPERSLPMVFGSNFSATVGVGLAGSGYAVSRTGNKCSGPSLARGPGSQTLARRCCLS